MKPGPGYAPKYTGTVWSLIFLDQLGADPADERVQRACDYVLRWCPTTSGTFGASGAQREAPPPPSAVIHCLNGNLLRALIGFGRLDDEPVQAAISWAARAITGGPTPRASTPHPPAAPGFACAANEKLPCGWGAVKELLGLARVPVPRRSAEVRAAVDVGAAFLLATDPARADYPMGWGNTRPSVSRFRFGFRFGFPSGYVADVLQTLEALCELGHGADSSLAAARELVLDGQDATGRWRNRNAYNRKTGADIEQQGAPSTWVTLRACTVLRATYGAVGC